MKVVKNYVWLLIFLVFGCQTPKEPKQAGLIYLNDFESIKGWVQVNLTRWPVHSGLFSNKLDSAHQYSLGFGIPFKEVSPRKLKTVKVSEWVYFTEKCEASLAMEVKNTENKSLVWNGVNLDEQIDEIGKWQQVNAKFSLKNDTFNKPGNIVNIYTWDKGGKTIYVDDIRVEFIEE